VPENALCVFWDLETTGLGRCRIVSIGWISEDESIQGELLTLPRISIENSATEIHGYTRDKLIEEGANTPYQQLTRFMKSIESVKRDVVLVAHNGKTFDTRVLRHELECEQVSLANNIIGFADTYYWIRYDCSITPTKMDNLLQTFFQQSSRTIHGALSDSIWLKRIVLHAYKYCNRIGYYETTETWLGRTDKWKDSSELIIDVMEELVFTVEKNLSNVTK
jgi:DNA polymerase III alpha subunit (gram-positive type)